MSVDIVVVGQGVVGQLASLLFARRGFSVLAIERHPEPYVFPRAVHYDPDVNRLLAQLGIDRVEQESFSVPSPTYDWFTSDLRLMLAIPSPEHGDQGWPDSTAFSQPDLEEILRGRQETQPGLTIRRSVTFVDYAQDENGVDVVMDTPEGRETIRTSYLIGTDGANSTVRDAMGVAVVDLDFSSDWLVIDLLMDEDVVAFPADEMQICDPARPTTIVRGGPGRRRFELMLQPREDPERFKTEENAWSIVGRFGVTPANASIERLALYSFRARYASKWRDGRVFLAGDAAHQMPPFYGRGLVSGIRDVANLYWKLDLVSRGVAHETLLGTYDSERIAHLQFALNMSVELGRIVCTTDPAAVAARDEHFLSNGPSPLDVLPPMPPEILGEGYFPVGARGVDPVAGKIGVQGRLRAEDDTVSYPDDAGLSRFTLVLDGRRISDEDAATIRAAVPAGFPVSTFVVVDDAATRRSGTSGDVDGRYVAAFDELGVVAILYRPDYHGYGSATTTTGTRRLMAGLRGGRA